MQLLSSMAHRLVPERCDHRFVTHSRLRSGFSSRGPTWEALSVPANDCQPAARDYARGKRLLENGTARTGLIQADACLKSPPCGG